MTCLGSINVIHHWNPAAEVGVSPAGTIQQRRVACQRGIFHIRIPKLLQASGACVTNEAFNMAVALMKQCKDLVRRKYRQLNLLAKTTAPPELSAIFRFCKICGAVGHRWGRKAGPLAVLMHQHSGGEVLDCISLSALALRGSIC